MSRIGKHPVVVPSGVTATVNKQVVSVKGKLGELKLALPDDLSVVLDQGKIVILPRDNDNERARQAWGTNRTLVANMVKGVSEGFSTSLEINGVGFRAAVQGKDLVLQLGFSHEVKYHIPAGITIKADKPTNITISGADRQRVGQVAAEIRGLKKPEPYKGKGIKYDNEVILRKEGKKK
ncbi:MAG: 50S ribosomal protein L6 [Pseudomonadota bacterium]|nr:50S ribosomal protein L6 [Pseudomonadota bacterium]